MHLIFAAFWILVGVGILVLNDPRLIIGFGGIRFSSGWLAFLLAGYNLARWWNVRSYRRQRRLLDEAAAQREQRRRLEQRRERGETYDPNFDFSKPAPPPEGEQHLRPPP